MGQPKHICYSMRLLLNDLSELPFSRIRLVYMLLFLMLASFLQCRHITLYRV